MLILPAHAIVQGERVSPNAAIAKAVVHLYALGGEVCSGTLIARDVILTAAHCLTAGKRHYVVFKRDAAPRQVIGVRRFVLHPQYRLFSRGAKEFYPDLALVQLVRNAPDSYTPISLSSGIYTGKMVTVAGWGKMKSNAKASFNELNSVSLLASSRLSPSHIALYDPETALTREGKGACAGDSGGPAIYGGGVAGVLMMAAGVKGEGCGGITMIVTLDSYTNWIEATLQSLR